MLGQDSATDGRTDRQTVNAKTIKPFANVGCNKDIMRKECIPYAEFNEYMDDEYALTNAKKKLVQYGFLVVNGGFNPKTDSSMHGIQNTNYVKEK